jgi:penicillin-binding protein 1A
MQNRILQSKDLGFFVVMQRYLWPLRVLLALGIAAAIAIALALAGAYQYLGPDLPDVATLRDVRLQVPLRVYSRDGRLIAQIGEQRRIPLPYSAYPNQVVNAFLAAEDDRFFAHGGVDYQGLMRAALVNFRSGGIREGGGTITMQLARDVFLTPDRNYRRKLLEIFLALRIEHEFSKQEILELYLNKIFLGQRAYGVGAAAEVYFGKTVDQLDIGEIALIAGLPRAPSRDNPVTDPERARQRRAYVLRRLLEKRYIDGAAYEAALESPVESRIHGPAVELDAPYIAEMVRAEMLDRFGPDAYTAGYRVITTVDSHLQVAATNALRLAVLEYDSRHGYRGPAGNIDLGTDTSEAAWRASLEDYPTVGGLQPGVVIAVDGQHATAYLTGPGRIDLGWNGLSWARRATADFGVGPAPRSADEVVAKGDVVYVAQELDGSLRLMQVPAVQGAFVAVDPLDGAVVALSGGFDYFASKFNRAFQARRQPGSAFKPFIYSAALNKGFTPATLVNDAPIVFDDPSLENSWRPQNVSRRFYGPTRVREALVRSRNLVSIRMMNSIGPSYATRYIERFGFNRAALPENLTLALGTAQVSPLQMAEGYSVFANGGYRVQTYLIDRVLDAQDEVAFTASPAYACVMCRQDADAVETDSGTIARTPPPTGAAAAQSAAQQERADLERWGARDWLDDRLAPQVIDPRNAYLLTDMMTDVVRRGTATRARVLNRQDIAGKTGTTNDRRDAWFCGFNADIVATAWVGFDQERSLGAREEGGRTALPMWIYFMQEALKGKPDHRLPPPPGLVTMRISAETGLPARTGDADTIFESFIAGTVPHALASSADAAEPGIRIEDSDDDTDPLF